MRARTRLEREVERLSAKLPPLDEKRAEWAKKHFYSQCFYFAGKRAWCTECGEVVRWVDSNPLATTIGLEDITCPKCGKTLTARRSLRRTHKAEPRYYFEVLTTIEGWQVVRHFLIERWGGMGKNCGYSINEVVQVWLNDDGYEVTMARPRMAMSCYVDSLQVGKPLGVRYRYDGHADVYRIYCDTAPGAGVTRRLRRNGYRVRDYRMATSEVMRGLLTSPTFETLAKMGQYSLMRYFWNHPSCNIGNYMPSIRICARNGYTVEDASLWVDMVDTLRALGKDLHNAHYVCPKNLHEAHDKWLAKRNSREVALRRRKKLEECREHEADYAKAYSAWLGVRLRAKGLKARPLQSVAEFFEEGEAMHHCVFANKYYKRRDLLIFTVRGVHDERLATVEYNIRLGNVIQCRGACNAVPDKYKEIIDMFQAARGTLAPRAAANN